MSTKSAGWSIGGGVVVVWRRRRAFDADALWEFRARQDLAHAVAADAGDLAQRIEQAKRMQDGGLDAHADIGVARFDLLESRAGCERAFCHDGHGQSPPSTSIADICTKLAQDTPHSGRGMVWRWHMRPSRYQTRLYVARRLQ
jgi:hypothetical protein